MTAIVVVPGGGFLDRNAFGAAAAAFDRKNRQRRDFPEGRTTTIKEQIGPAI
jgi:hypothetical protein